MPEARDSVLAALEAEGSAVVALSGGVDSATLAVLSHLALGERSLAVTGVSASPLPSSAGARRVGPPHPSHAA